MRGKGQVLPFLQPFFSRVSTIKKKDSYFETNVILNFFFIVRYCSFSIVTECKSFAIVITNCNEINFQIIMNKSFQNYKYIKFMHQKKMTYSISVCNYCLYFDTINYLFSLKSLFQLFVSNIYAENSALS